MGDIKILHNNVLHETKEGKLSLYFPHNLDSSKDPDVLKDIEWATHSGLRFKKISKNKTEILYPISFNLSDCFYKRNQFEYVAGLNKTKNENLKIEDFFIFLYSRFLKKSKICNKSLSFFHDFSSRDVYTETAKKMSYFKYMCNSFDNKADDVVYTEDLDIHVDIFDYVRGNFLKSNEDKEIVYVKVGDSSKKYKKEKQFRYVHLPKIKIKGLKDDNFHDVINCLNNFFNFDNRELYYNIVCGLIFSQDLTKKSFVLDFSKKDKLLSSGGLFITETYIKIKELALITEVKSEFNSNVIEYYRSKSEWFFNANFLYSAIINHCKDIDKVLKDEEKNVNEDENLRIFMTGMMEDLILGMKMLGMFLVEEIDNKIKKD